MKSYKILTRFIFSLIFISSLAAQPIRVMTFNIRLDTPVDGQNNWKYRKANLVSMIRFHKADLVGLQEAQKHQIDYISQSLPEYGWIGVGRDDGKSAGEFAAIFYRKDRFDTLTVNTFWCSQTPEHPGLGWDAAYERVTTYAKFLDKASGKTFFMFNIHLDNEGAKARLESTKLIKRKIKSLCEHSPIILTGDFNSFPLSEPYKSMTAKAEGDTSFTMYDSKYLSATKPHGPSGTFTGFDLSAKPKAPIDFIFVRSGISVLYHGTLSDSFDGFLPSDHYAVLAEIMF